ncbi:MAG: site-specific integrase, partial [Patescibacteria group bacterium]
MAKALKELMKEFCEYLEIERGRSDKTTRNYHFYLDRFAKWAKYPNPGQITLEMVRKYRLYLNREIAGRDEDSLQKNTQNYHLIALRALLKYMAKRDIKSLSAD